MYVCICTPITDIEIDQCIAAGCSTVSSIRKCVGIVGTCGKCATYIKQMIVQSKGNHNVTAKSELLEQQ